MGRLASEYCKERIVLKGQILAPHLKKCGNSRDYEEDYAEHIKSKLPPESPVIIRKMTTEDIKKYGPSGQPYRSKRR